MQYSWYHPGLIGGIVDRTHPFQRGFDTTSKLSPGLCFADPHADGRIELEQGSTCCFGGFIASFISFRSQNLDSVPCSLNLRQMMRGEIPFQKASGGMHAGLSEGEFRGRDLSAAPRKRLITRPHSRKRMLWDLFGLVLVVWVACLTK